VVVRGGGDAGSGLPDGGPEPQARRMSKFSPKKNLIKISNKFIHA
jgi:hypothetical protein